MINDDILEASENEEHRLLSEAEVKSLIKVVKTPKLSVHYGTEYIDEDDYEAGYLKIDDKENDDMCVVMAFKALTPTERTLELFSKRVIRDVLYYSTQSALYNSLSSDKQFYNIGRTIFPGDLPTAVLIESQIQGINSIEDEDSIDDIESIEIESVNAFIQAPSGKELVLQFENFDPQTVFESVCKVLKAITIDGKKLPVDSISTDMLIHLIYFPTLEGSEYDPSVRKGKGKKGKNEGKDIKKGESSGLSSASSGKENTRAEIGFDVQKAKGDKAYLDDASLIEYLKMSEKTEKAVYVAKKAYKTAKSGCVERKVTPRKIEKRDVSKELIKPQAPVMEEYIPIPVPEERKIGPLQRGCCIVYIFSIMFLVILIGAFWYALLSTSSDILMVVFGKALLSTSSWRMIAAYAFFTIGYCVFVLWLKYRRDRIKSFEEVNKEIPIIIQTNKENEEIYQKAYNDNQAKYKKALEQYELDFTRLDIQAQEEYEQACVKRDKDYQRECEIAQANYLLVKNEVDWLKRCIERIEKTRERLYSVDYVPEGYRKGEEKADKSISGCKEVKALLSGLSSNITSIIRADNLVQSKQVYDNGNEVEIASESKLTSIIRYVLEAEEEVDNYISLNSSHRETEQLSSTNQSGGEIENTPNNEISNLSVCDIIEFGHYQHSNDSSEKQSLKWKVLKLDGKKAMLISEKVISCRPYEIKINGAPWKKCSLRKWLNEDFLKTAFGEQERDRILITTVVEDYVPFPASQGKLGAKTEDRVFLLSVPEAYEFFPSAESRKCEYTEFAKSEDEDNGCDGGWWLRSPGITYDRFARVSNDDGEMYNLLCTVGYGVRPVIWIEI